MALSKKELSQAIKNRATYLGFDACGFCKAGIVGVEEEVRLHDWLSKGYHAGMEYLNRNCDKRCNPTLLVDKAKSVICVALNYYPRYKQDPENPQFAYYAYGKDYHDVMKAKLSSLLNYIQSICSDVNGRCFCDTAPVLERYWAKKSGLGFIGKNTMLIIPKKGSFFFLGEIVIDAELEYDEPLNLSCGTCTRCIEACPSKALENEYILNSQTCISYQTIENKGEIDEGIKPFLGNCVYGCDICQNVCPWNRFASPHNTKEFEPKEEFLSLTIDKLRDMTVEEYRRLFKGSAVKRAKYGGLMRNIKALKIKK